MKTLFIFVTAITIFSNAMAKGWDNPTKPFDASKGRFTNTTTITWILVDNIQEACEKESKKLGNRGFTQQVTACAFWWNDKCTVITKKNPTMHSVGHEVRHCFQGNWH